MKRVVWVVGTGLCLALGGCERSADAGASAGGDMPGGMMHGSVAAVDTTGLRDLTVPEEFRDGALLFDASCASCHGEAALGTATGPPLVHIYYEPNHHADIAFILAAERGVRAHHWRFGDMPPQPAVTRDEVLRIIEYVRWLQREAGIY